MPELPEAETVARTLYPHVVDCVISGVNLVLPSTLHPQSAPLTDILGMRIKGTRRRGKLVLLDLEPAAERQNAPDCLVFHLRMTGRLLTVDADEPLRRHSRCVFGLACPDGGRRQLFFDDTRAFGKIMAATPQILQAWDFWRELGPEPLEVDHETFAARLKGARKIKTALLDQKVIAGIGNIYADEGLFQAGIDPARSAGSLTAKESAALLDALRDVLKRSIAQCGSSIRDYRDANGNVGAFQNSFAVYGRGGKECKKCGAPLAKTRITGRATVFCPNCQK